MRLIAILFALLGIGAAQSRSSAPATMTRVLIVVLDDVGKPLLADAPTPSLDRIARLGRTYTRAWGAPLCSVARAELVTGLWPMRAENLIGANIHWDGTYALPPLVSTLPARVVAAGRSATHRGKWHLAPHGTWLHPLEVGYSHASGSESNLGAGGPGNYFDWRKMDDGAAYNTTVYATTDTADDALADVVAGVDLVVAQFNAPHKPYHCPPAWLAPQSACSGGASDYDKAKAMLEAADTEIGRLLSVALAQGYTCIVMADNGASGGLGGGGKGSLYEDGLCVPWYVVGPGIPAGTSDALVSLVDIAPTVLDGLGIAFDPAAFDGVSMWAEMHGAPAAPRTLYCDRWADEGQPPGTDWTRAIRDERWKLHTGPGTPVEEFYDLDADPAEETNLLLGTLDAEQQAAYAALVAALP